MNNKRIQKYPYLKFFLYLAPFLGVFIAWKVTGLIEIGIYMLAVVGVVNLLSFLRNRKK